MLKFVYDLWIKKLRYSWSNFRHRNSPKHLTSSQSELYDNYFPRDIEGIKLLLPFMLGKFKYTPDPWHRLFDSIDTPASCWLKALESPPLKDDCDGFHSALYLAVSVYLKARLLTVVTSNLVSSHTFLIVITDNNYYYVDYWYLSNPFTSLKDLLDDVDKRYDNRNLKIITKEISVWYGQGWASSKLYSILN